MRNFEAIKNVLRSLGTVVTSLLLLATFLFLFAQNSWDSREVLAPRDAFIRGSIGTELMPYPAFVALPDIAPDLFYPQGKVDSEPNTAFWHFGMNDRLSEETGLPTGFFRSNKRPRSGAPSPVEFVGISCVMCHSTEIYKANGESKFIVGPGNVNLNLFAWIDSFQAAVLRDSTTSKAIAESYQRQTGEKLTATEGLMLSVWLTSAKAAFSQAEKKFGTPHEGLETLKSSNIPTGPCRTQPFRTLVRRLMDRSGNDMAVYTKISAIFNQDRREWAQVDGSINDLDVRSSMAAYAAGATIQNMALDDVADNIRKASTYARDLGAPNFSEVFPEVKIDHAAVQRGAKVYAEYCHDCHGTPSSTIGWTAGKRLGDVVPIEEIGTDSERVQFEGYSELPDLIQAAYPDHHPFHFERKQLRPLPNDKLRGYVNAPIEHAYLRAPYLHNASVLTLAELINLNQRRDVFYRGRNIYDQFDIGLLTPTEPTREIYFKFDTTIRGNSNGGHDYPWSWDDPNRDPEKLKDLLEYLKTI